MTILDENSTQILINNSDKIFPYFLVLIIALVIAIALFRDRILKKYVESYFNEELSKELRNYKKEFFSLLEDTKLSNKFKKQPILILNDVDGVIQEVAYMAHYINHNPHSIDDEIAELHNYRLVILYIPKRSSKFNPEELFDRYVEKIATKLDKKNTLFFTYHEGRIESNELNKLPKHNSFVNSKLTLVEKLENAYIVKKIMDLEA